MGSKSDQAPLVAVVGETASGKSTLAIALAERFGGEIVCADSWTVYKYFDVGTAKPTPEDRLRIRHHLLDIVDPHDGFSAAEFKLLAKQAIADITSRGRLPILTGGTGLYVDSVLFDYSFLPPGDKKLREELNSLSISQLIKKAEESKLDLSDIDLRNKRRIIRLIESGGMKPSKGEMRKHTTVLGVEIERQLLKEKIMLRVDDMFRQGLASEVESLSSRYGWDVEPMKGIGYREFHDYFSGNQTLEVTRDKIIHSTLDLAKRQRTWFRRNKSIHWIPGQEQAVDILTTELNK